MTGSTQLTDRTTPTANGEDNSATRPVSNVVPIKSAKKRARDIPEWMHGPATRWDGWGLDGDMPEPPWDLGPGLRLVLVDGDTPRDVA
jgi:hypothetical protein